MDMSKYKDLFISEAREHVQGMNNCILVLEKDTGSEESINELFRHAHSVKGMAASMGFGRIAELGHQLEDMMDTVRQGDTNIDSRITDILLDGVDALENLVDLVEKDADLEQFDTTELITRVLRIIQGDESIDPAPDVPKEEISKPSPVVEKVKEAVPDEPTTKIEKGELFVRFKIDPNCVVPCARAYLAIKRIGELGKIKESVPGIDDIKGGNCDGEVALVVTDALENDIRGTLEGLAEMGSFSIVGPGTASPPKKEEKAEKAKLVKEEAPEKAEGKKPDESAKPPAAAAAKTVRISTALLDTFINLVGELIVTKSRLTDLLQRTDSRIVDQVMTRLDHLVGGLHGEVMKVRMTALETVTQRLPRVVRDLARKSGKKISLEIIGADIELDRAVLEEIGDPLVHLLRNSVDHGIEPPAERKKSGKDETGKIVINCFRERDMVHIEITDDGRGMDLERVREKAVGMKLISPDQAKVISDEDTVMLVCRPGFSTAKKVTDVSGRGVGMDVVQSVVESMGGSLVIESRTGDGTTFTMRLPLTVAIVKMLLVRVQDHLFAIPITRVLRTLRVTEDEINESQGRMYLSIDEELIALYELKEKLEVSGEDNGQPYTTVVLVEATNRTVGMVVDDVAGQVDIVVKPLCYPLQYLKRYSGMTVLGDGRIVPILDLGNLL